MISPFANGQSNIIEIIYTRPPLNQLRADDLWNFTLKNNSNQDLEFTLNGTLTESKNGLIATGQTMAITLRKGETKKFKVSDLPKTPDINYIHPDERYKNALIRTGNLPEGSYTICITAKQVGTNEVLGEDCIEQDIEKTSEAEISLLSPGNNETLNPDESINFTWMPIGNIESGSSYKIKIVEIKGDESPENAMLKNKAFFEKEEIRSTTFQYPITAPKFEIEKKYAWQVSTNSSLSNIQIIKTTSVNNSNQDCIDFENSNSTSNWESDYVSSVQITKNGNDKVNNTNTLVLTDGAGPSIAWNDVDFSGNWLERGTDGCLCFQYKVDWNTGVATNMLRFPAVYIYTGAPINNVNDFNYHRVRALFVGHPTNPMIQDNIWNNWCFAIGPCINGNLPTNNYGYWEIRGIGNVILSGQEACDAWDNLIQNVTGIVMATDYNSQPSEKVYFDNFCWTCDETVINSNPCNGFTATSEISTGNCCWNIDLTFPSNTLNVNRIKCRVIEGGTEFVNPVLNPNYTVPGSDWLAGTINNSEINIVRKNSSMPIPGGTLNDMFSYCLSYTNVPQKVVVDWIAGENTVCSDTLISNCDIPCVTYSEPVLDCINDDEIKVTFNITNVTNTISTGFNISNVEIVNTIPAGITVSPSNISLIPALSPGATTSSPLSIILNGANSGDVVKIIMRYTDECCSCLDTLTVTIPECICTKVEATLSGDPITCCYNLNITNNYSSNFFDQINVRLLDNIEFRNWSFGSGWGSSISIPPSEVNMFNFSGFIPTGSNNNIFNFCLNGYENTLPQKIVIEWINNGNIVCRDTLTTPCPPPVPPGVCLDILENSIECLENGSFKYNFKLRNNSGFTVDGFDIQVISPYSLTLNEYEHIVTIGQNQIVDVELILSGIAPSTAFCLKFALFKYGRNTDGTIMLNSQGQKLKAACCYSEHCFSTINCPGQCECNEDGWKKDSVYIKLPDGKIKSVLCGNTIVISKDDNITIQAPEYECKPSSCEVVYKLELSDDNGIIQTVNTRDINYTFNNPGDYTLRIEALCNNVGCEKCIINIKVEDRINCNCNFGSWDTDKINLSINNIGKIILCGNETEIKLNDQVVITMPNYNCPPNCRPSYEWTLIGGSGAVPVNISGNTNIIAHTFNVPGSYVLRFYALCNGVKCERFCEIKINVPPIPPCDCSRGHWDLLNNTIKYSNSNSTRIETIFCNRETYMVDYNSNVTLSPSYNCPENCGPVSYSYTINGGPEIFGNFTIQNVTSELKITLIARCGRNICSKCEFIIKPKENIGCNCGTSNFFTGNVTLTRNNTPRYIACGTNSTQQFAAGNYNIVAPGFQCAGNSPTQNCPAEYKYDIFRNGARILNGSGNSISTSLTGPSSFFGNPITYRIEFEVFCNGISCGKCIVSFRVGNVINTGTAIGWGSIRDRIFDPKPNVGPTIFNPSGSLNPTFKFDFVKSGVLKLIEINSVRGSKLNLESITENLEVIAEIPISNSDNFDLSKSESKVELKNGYKYLWILVESVDENSEPKLLESGIFIAGDSNKYEVISDNCDNCEKCDLCFEFEGKCYCIRK